MGRRAGGRLLIALPIASMPSSSVGIGLDSMALRRLLCSSCVYLLNPSSESLAACPRRCRRGTPVGGGESLTGLTVTMIASRLRFALPSAWREAAVPRRCPLSRARRSSLFDRAFPLPTRRASRELAATRAARLAVLFSSASDTTPALRPPSALGAGHSILASGLPSSRHGDSHADGRRDQEGLRDRVVLRRPRLPDNGRWSADGVLGLWRLPWRGVAVQSLQACQVRRAHSH